MNELTIEPAAAVIVFHDKSHKYITASQYENLVVMSTNPNAKQVQIGLDLYAKSSIQKILSLKEFNEEYPEKKQAPQFEDGFKKYESLTDKLPINGLPSLIKGLARFIKGYEADGKIAVKSRKLLERYEAKLK